MKTDSRLSLADPFAVTLQTIASHAAAADRGEATLAPDLCALHDCGMLASTVRDCLLGGRPLAGAGALRQIGRASLPVGRIVEGHVNALRLILMYGSSAQRQHAARAADRGVVMGVWGADGTDPVTLDPAGATLRGAKQFCSGIGLVGQAVIPVKTEAGPQLFTADVTDPARGDTSGWQVSGMRATASGRFDMTGLPVERLGEVNDYLREPHFEGGIWRYCAVQCGGLEALAEAARQHILTRGQTGDLLQRARFARLFGLAHGARLWVDTACASVERTWQTASVPLALLARDAVEQACQSGIALTERIMGTAAFDSRSDADRIRRDLGFFLRQANLDAKLDKAADALLDPGAAVVGEVFA